MAYSERKRTREENSGEPLATGKVAGGEETGSRKPSSDRKLRPAKITQHHDPTSSNEQKI